MKNKMLIRAEMEQNEYADYATLLADIKANTVIKYFLSVNDEEVAISPTMAFNIAAFFDEYNREMNIV